MKKRIISVLLVAMFIMQLAPAFAAGFSSDPDAVEQAAKSVLMLEVYDADNELIATGSGFVAFNNRTIVTNHHVIEGADWMLAYSDDGYEYAVTKVLTADEERDIAICSFMSPTDLKPLEFNVKGELKRIESVVAIGSPKGLTNTISLGNISALFEEDGVYWVQFTAPISAGSSGGALFDDNGRVIGVTSAVYNDEFAQNINFAVHVSEVQELYDAWDGSEARFEEYEMIANATPTPEPTATPKPTPEPKKYTTLKRGDSGIEVYKMKKKLALYGYLANATHDKFDFETEQAVAAFNLQNFGVESKIADEKMQELLFEGESKGVKANFTPVPTTTPEPNVYEVLKRGDHNEKVYKLKKRLSELGYLDKGSISAVFDFETEQAVISFNKQNFGVANKNADNRMQKLLFEGNASKAQTTPTPKPTATSVPYTALRKGDKGEEVRRLQVELIKWGYLTGSADGVFGSQTEAAVTAFNKQNFSVTSKVATSRMLNLLFHGKPKKFKDVDMALYFKPGNSYAEWEYLSGDKLRIHFQVSNQAVQKTVKAFELYVYAENVWGEEIYDNSVYYWTTTKTVAPGKTVYSDYVTIPNRSEISKVYCGIHKVAYTNGKTYTVPDHKIDYHCWTIK